MKKWLKRILYFSVFLFILLNIICASQAYKLTHVYDRGTEPKGAAKAMGFFSVAKTIILGQDNYKLALKDKPKQLAETIELTTSDGLKLEGWDVEQKNAIGTVILFHGHGGNRVGVLNEAEAFYNLRYNVVMVDFRAHGNSSGNSSSIGYLESADVKAAYDFVSRSGEKNIILYGISLGAASITKAMHDYAAIQPKKIIIEMPFATLQDAVKGRLKMMNVPGQPFATLLTFWGGIEQGFWAFNNKPEEFVKSINVPVLMQWGKQDTRVSEAETNSVFANLASKDKSLVIYENSGHQSLCTNEEGKWLSTVIAFLNKK